MVDEATHDIMEKEGDPAVTFDKTMFLHEIATALLLSDMGIHIQGTGVEEQNVGIWHDGVLDKTLVVTMRNGERYTIIVHKEV